MKFMENNNPSPADKNPKAEEGQSFWELIRFVIVAIAIVIPIRVFVAQPFVVSGLSMVPTFQDGEYLIVDEISYRFEEPKRGDVVIFRYPKDPSKFFIKRIIGLPNEIVDVSDNEVTIYSDENKEGVKLTEPYIHSLGHGNSHIVLKNDEYFVMGDNRAGSSDSRIWGPVKREYIIGNAFLRLLPIKRIDLNPGDYKQE
jgi:signal peptidase I